jgi:alpha-2-macroglobulin
MRTSDAGLMGRRWSTLWGLLVVLLSAQALVVGGCTKKTEDGGEPSEVVPVELDLWAGVPALVAQVGDIPDALVPEPGPAKPAQVGEIVELPFPPPISAEPPPGASEQPSGPLEVLRYGPDGDQTLVEAIRVSFNHPMVPLASIEALRQQPAPLTIEPAVEGEFRWLGTRTVAFYPSGRLPYSTDYTVTIPAKTASTFATELAKEVRWTVSTPRLALDRSVPAAYGGETHVALDQPLVLRFNQAVDPAKIAAALTLKTGATKVALEPIPPDRWKDEAIAPLIHSWVTGDDQDWQRARVVVLKPRTELAPDKQYTVELPAGVYGEGPRKSDKIQFSFRTYPPLKLSQHACDPSPCSASAGILIDASNQIRDGRVAQMVHVTPPVEGLDIRPGWNGIALSGKFVGETRYQVTVDAGITDIYGQALAKPFTTQVELGALDPELRIWPEPRHPGIIEAKAGHTLELRVAGLRELEIIGGSFNSAELTEYFDARSYDDWPSGLSEPVARKKLDVSGSRKQAQTITIDVDDFIEGTDTFVYLLARSEEVEQWGWKQRLKQIQLVQVTDLGLTAAFDRGSGVVEVTSLSTGKPVADADVRILTDKARRERWKGKTNAAGVANPKLTGGEFYSPILVVRKGDDEVYLPLDTELRGRWISGLFGRDAEAEVRGFMFTDRVPYKPGETVHLVGVLRNETKGPSGGIELWGANARGKYTVTTARGVKVSEGELTVGPFGTFSLDIDTDADGDTGDYRFELRFSGLFGKDRTFNHSFAVEEFRTPEFEVEVARLDSKPLYYGDQLEVEIRGRYLFGAPMIGAEARYTLTRQASEFRPPAEGLGAFHFAAEPGRRWGLGGYWGGSWNPVEQLDAKSLVLDDNGILKVSHALAQVEPKPAAKPNAEPSPISPTLDEPPLPKAATFTVAATVTDDNRQAIAGTGSFVVHPSAYYVGLRSERSVLRANQRTKVEAVVVDVDGKRVADVSVDLRSLRKQTTRKPIEKDGVWSFEYETSKVETDSCTLSSAGSPVSCEITVGEAGTHELVAVITDGEGRKNQAAIEIFVHGDDAVVWDKDQKRVDLVADKASYEPGEVAKILVRSPFDAATGFLIVEREGRAQTHPLAVRGGVAVVDVEIEPAMVAGVTISAVLSKPRTQVRGVPDDQDLGAPAAATGELALEVGKARKTVVVEVTPSAAQIEPGAKLRVDLHTHSVDGEPIPAAVALFVVDEGVLNLMGYETPNPLDFFHRTRPGEVGLFADHPLVLARKLDEQPVANTPTPDEPLMELDGDMAADAYGAGGLGLSGTGRGGGGTGEGTIGLGNVGTIGKGGTGTGSGYGSGGEKRKAESKDAAPSARPRPQAAPAAPPAPGGAPATITGIDASKAMAQAVDLRSLFATTAYFDADVSTGINGRTSVEITMPENLTSFRIMAVAVDPIVRDRFGSGEASVRVRKSIMLRPSLPRFLNLGDRFEASVMVDNQSDDTQVVLVGTRGLNVMIAGPAQTTVEIPPGGAREVRFPMAVDQVGTMRLQFAALANNGRDATEIDLPVLVPATKQAFADYGMTSSSVTRMIEVPKDALPGFGGLELSLSSTALNGLEDAVEYLVHYRYECSEQTASRILPIFALGKILDDFPIADVRDRARRDALGNDGIARLLRRQNPDGGFGFWSNDGYPESWPYVSTWVTFALLEGKRAGYAVDQAKLDRALSYLERYVRNGVQTRWGVYYDWTSRAFAMWLLSGENRGAELFDTVWAQRAKLPLYARILLATAAHRYGKTKPVDATLAELRDLVIENAKVIHFAESKSEAGSADGLAVLMHSNTQTDAIALMFLLELGAKGGELGDDGMAPKIMAGIMDDRDPKLGGRWKSTHANAWALLSASRYYAVMEAETPDFSAKIWLDGLFAGERAFVGRDMTKINMQVPMTALLGRAPAPFDGGSSVEQVTVAKDGPGKLYYRLGLRYAPADFHMDPVDRGYTVSRRYQALAEAGQDAPDPDAVVQAADGSYTVKAGTNVKVTITLVAQDRSNYVVVDDPLPAGFEGQNPRFLTSVAATSEATVDYGYGRGGRPGRGGFDFYGDYGGYGSPSFGGWWFPWFRFDHTQMRDDRMLLFADRLAAGVYTYSYTARATNIGTFILPPVHAEAMYEPERFGHGASSVVTIVE